MLPRVQVDLGKHCFGYAHLLAGEFYNGPAGGKGEPKDLLGLRGGTAGRHSALFLGRLREELDSDWEKIDKVKGRVTQAAFVDYFARKYEESCPFDQQEAFKKFLAQDFLAASAMMKPRVTKTIGGHCFRYAAMMAGEFYFNGKPTDVLELR